MEFQWAQRHNVSTIFNFFFLIFFRYASLVFVCTETQYVHNCTIAWECPEFYWFVFGIYFSLKLSGLLNYEKLCGIFLFFFFIYVNMSGFCDCLSFVSPKIEHLNGVFSATAHHSRTSDLYPLLGNALVCAHKHKVWYSNYSFWHICSVVQSKQPDPRPRFSIKFIRMWSQTLIHRAWLSAISDSRSENCGERWKLNEIRKIKFSHATVLPCHCSPSRRPMLVHLFYCFTTTPPSMFYTNRFVAQN